MRVLFFLVLLSGCGYRWQPECPSQARPTVSVPFVQGDEEGTLTSAIVRTLTALGIADVFSHAGDLRLQIAIVDTKNQPVGYRLDKQKISGEIKKNIVACEGRKTITVEATLFEGNSDCVIKGPYTISEDADYDYVDGDSIQDLAFVNTSGVLTPALPFSLGQLESVESAQEAAHRPLYERLARKIADTLF